MKSAMKNGDKERLATIRLILAAVKQIEVDTREEVDDQNMLVILDKMAKQRRESINQFEQAGRQDLVTKETQELGIITEFLPQALTDEEISELIEQAMQESAASSMKDMGKVMGILKPKIQGRADMGQVSQLIKSKLS